MLREASLLALSLVIIFVISGCQSPSESATANKGSGSTTSRRSSVPAGKATGVLVSSPPAVEWKARRRPRASPPKIVPTIFEKKVPGTQKCKCVNVNSVVKAQPKTMRRLNGAVRSGEFIGFAFDKAVNPPPEVNPLWTKIPWSPLHTQKMPGLKLRAIPLDGSGKVRTNYHGVAYSTGVTSRRSEKASKTRFYPGTIKFSDGGRWRLIVASGFDWGCFDLRLPEK